MKTHNSAVVKQKLAVQGAESLGTTPEECGAYIKSEIARWTKLVKATGIKVD